MDLGSIMTYFAMITPTFVPLKFNKVPIIVIIKVKLKTC